ncbi:MAG: type II toxin-antitoxin system VapC family toxin, partial [Victivallales bacterium]|nr:type II toxin-antitoxin system VapC family toxin [Victivallales bacterium]
IDFSSGEHRVLDAVRSAKKIFIPFIVLGELRSGFACGVKAKRNEAVLIEFLNEKYVDVLYADEDTTFYYATLFAQLRRQGTPIPTNDLWIAALSLQFDMILVTRDAHFKNLPQIPIV